MAKILSREQLKNYCVTALGHPVVNIEVADVQLEDRVDDAIQTYLEFHPDASVERYLKYTVTREDLDRGYIELPSEVISVSRLVPVSSTFFPTAFAPMYSAEFLNNLTLGNGLVHYMMAKDQLRLIDLALRALPDFAYSRNNNRIYPTVTSEHSAEIYFREGKILLFQVYMVHDPEEVTEIYNDRILKAHSISLIKKQWGQNLMKYEGMQLPGSMTYNGRQMYDDATAEIEGIMEQYDTRDEPMAILFG